MLNWYIVYIIISFLLLFYINRTQREPLKTTIVQSLIVVTLPVIGWFLLFVWKKNNNAQSYQEFSDYIDKQQNEHRYYRDTFNPIEKDRELNIIPLEEALVINNFTDRRRTLIEVLKQDTLKYMEKLQHAISNDDTETSHYAVSAIMEIKSKLLTSIQELEVKYEQSNVDKEISESYIEVLDKYLNSGLLDPRTKRKYQFTYLSVLKNYLEVITPKEHYYEEKLRMELELGIYTEAEQTANEYVEEFPKSEKAYLSLLKYYYVVKSNDNFFSAIEKIKLAPIKLSNEGITILRFWTKGVNNEAESKN